MRSQYVSAELATNQGVVGSNPASRAKFLVSSQRPGRHRVQAVLLHSRHLHNRRTSVHGPGVQRVSLTAAARTAASRVHRSRRRSRARRRPPAARSSGRQGRADSAPAGGAAARLRERLGSWFVTSASGCSGAPCCSDGCAMRRTPAVATTRARQVFASAPRLPLFAKAHSGARSVSRIRRYVRSSQNRSGSSWHRRTRGSRTTHAVAPRHQPPADRQCEHQRIGQADHVDPHRQQRDQQARHEPMESDRHGTVALRGCSETASRGAPAM
jgi:hypothetical protein